MYEYDLQFRDFDTKTGDTVKVSGGWNIKRLNVLKILQGSLSSLDETSFRLRRFGRVEFVSDGSSQGKGFIASVRYGMSIF